MNKVTFMELLNREDDISYKACQELWEDEDTLVHQDTSDQLMSEIADHIAMRLNLKKSDRILTIGCGDGYIDRFLAPKVELLYGIDFSHQKIEAAKKRNPGLDYEHYDFLDSSYCEKLKPFGFNKIYSYSVMQYCKTDDVRLFLENQITLLDSISGGVICHLDIPDVDKALYYYEPRCIDVTDKIISENRSRIKNLIGDGSCWHDMARIRQTISEFDGIISLRIDDAHYWKFRSDLTIVL